MPDLSNGYEAIAEHFVRARRPTIGPSVVRNWAKDLPPGASILDLGCGSGIPISDVLLQDGFMVYGVDASVTLSGKFRERFPNCPVEFSSVEDSSFFGRTFDGVIAWGLMFILTVETQLSLIGKVARVLGRQSRFLFTSPQQACTWTDSLTGLPSISPGREVYQQALTAHGLVVVGHDEDEGGNYYYFAEKS